MSESSVLAVAGSRRRVEEAAPDEKSADSILDKKGPAVLLSRTTINQNTRNALKSLVEHEMLAEFWTTFVWNPKSIWHSLLPTGLGIQLSRRSIPEAPSELVRSVRWRELIRLGLRGTPLMNLLSSGERPFSVLGMGLHFDSRVARRVKELRPDVVYAYDGSALQTFRMARKLGITAICDHTSGYWQWERRLFAEEAELNPEYAGLLPGLMDSAAHLERKNEELQLADYVFVPSEYVRQSLSGFIADEKVRVIGYGAPPVSGEKRPSRDAGKPLKVLFAGTLIQRKGIGYLLEAMKMLGKQAELTMVGARPHFHPQLEEACTRHRWMETLPHSQMLILMQESDVLVLPSLSDAFGLVVTEALACGLPVIVTPNTGASEIIRDGREGYVVPIRRADMIAARLESLHSDRIMLAEMSQRARATAAQNTWEHYRANWARQIRSLWWH